MNNRPSMCTQAARGPVLLMVVGALFALQQSGVVAFSRSWPLLIIAIGVLKLVERMVTNQARYNPAPTLSPRQAQPNPGIQPPPPSNFPAQPIIRATRYSDFRSKVASGVQAPASSRPNERGGDMRR